MDATMMTAQAMGQASYFYNQDARRQHGYFQPHLAMQQQQMIFPAVPTLPSTPMYSRPGSACSQPQGPTLYSNAPANMVTPMASPQPLTHKPAIMVETEIRDNDMYYPATPPLSTSGSVVGSPSSVDMLQTPMNPMFSGLDGVDGLKDAFEPTNTFVVDWANVASPPLTPVFLPQSQSTEQTLITSTNPANLISSVSACPSLSPSPSPYARSVSSEQDVDFCDPRNLTVTANSGIPADFSGLKEEDVTSEQGSPASSSAISQATFDFSTALPDTLSTFGDLSDLEAETDLSGLLDIEQVSTAVSECGRPRACTGSSVVSFGHGSFIGEELTFNDSETFPFPALHSTVDSSALDGDSHRDKRVKKSDTPCAQKDACKMPTANAVAPAGQPSTVEQDSTSTSAQSTESSSTKASSSGVQTPVANPAPANRRGRKQSLTEDPSKTFVCDLCNRRFRRQEHLKRHYRSLHTQEKPFECNECGKKFSRSDNLAQHARTHGSGAIVMDLIEDHEAHLYNTALIGESFNSMGKVLFQVAAEMPGSASATDMSSEDETLSKKKRKRSD